jgi:DNA-binding CsgD family transcriptional regulator
MNDIANFLTERELEVARLVAKGRSCELIAKEAGISSGTAKTHIANIGPKVGGGGRVAIASWLGRHEMLVYPERAVPIPEETLSPAEWRVLAYVSRGLSNKQIARRSYVRESTVKSQVRSILAKLQAPDRAAAAYVWSRHCQPASAIRPLPARIQFADKWSTLEPQMRRSLALIGTGWPATQVASYMHLHELSVRRMTGHGLEALGITVEGLPLLLIERDPAGYMRVVESPLASDWMRKLYHSLPPEERRVLRLMAVGASNVFIDRRIGEQSHLTTMVAGRFIQNGALIDRRQAAVVAVIHDPLMSYYLER